MQAGVTTIVTLRGTTGIVTTIDAISLQATNLVITGVSTGITLGTLDELQCQWCYEYWKFKCN